MFTRTTGRKARLPETTLKTTMSTTILKLIRKLFPRKTVDSVIGQFNKTIAELEAVAEREAAEHKSFLEQAAALKQRADDANVERARAESIKARVLSLVA